MILFAMLIMLGELLERMHAERISLDCKIGPSRQRRIVAPELTLKLRHVPQRAE